MTQPTLPDGPPVPLLVEGMIDSATLRQLFADLAAAAVVLSIREKGDPREYADGAERTLEAALDRLLTGSAQAVQIRYRHDGHEWSDTVIATPTGFRVVRCRHDP